MRHSYIQVTYGARVFCYLLVLNHDTGICPSCAHYQWVRRWSRIDVEGDISLKLSVYVPPEVYDDSFFAVIIGALAAVAGFC